MPAHQEEDIDPALAALARELGISPADLPSVTARVIGQWREVLPPDVIRRVWQEAAASPEPLHAFRTAAQHVLRLAGRRHSPPIAVSSAGSRPLSPHDLQALAAQDRLVAMSDAEYQAELFRRWQRRRRRSI